MVGVGITNQCNMNCGFCYSMHRRRECLEIPLNTWMSFFKQAHHQISSINYGTGENTLADEWFSLIQYIHDIAPEIDQALTTNGSLITEIEKNSSKSNIVEQCICDIDISLDYADADKHNEFRGNKNAYQMAIGTLEYCAERGFNTTIVIMGGNDNLSIENLSGLFEIASKYSSLLRVNIYRTVNPNGYIKPPSLKKLIEVFDWINENHIICSLSDPLFSATMTAGQVKDDPSGKNSIRILPDGGIYPSTYLINKKYCLGNIKEKNILHKLHGNLVISRLTDIIPESCNKCNLRGLCQGGAIDRRVLTRKSIARRDPYCPVINGLSPKMRNYQVNDIGFSSIHDGYLPTLFFKPKNFLHEDKR